MAYAGVLLLVVIAHAALPDPARAFSDPLTFTDDVALGGGGGRFFTGSAADGFGCDVCHRGGPSTELRFLGLPLSGYRPGASYEVQLEWPAQLEHIGLALEISDGSGRAAGSLRLPPAGELPEPERCEPVEDELAAGVLTELEGGRTILSVPDCGARRVRVLWTAPAEPRASVRLSGGFVVSDHNTDFAGDGTTMFVRALAPEGDAPAHATEITAQCGVRPGPRSRQPLVLVSPLACCALLAVRARRRRRCAR